MKILALVTDGFGASGGIAQYNRDLIASLCALDRVESCRVVPRHGDSTRVPPNSPKLKQEPASRGRIRYVLQAFRAALLDRPDVIFCGHLFAAPLAWTLSRLTRCRFWLQVHGIEAWQPRSRLIRFAAERADLVTAVSRFTRRRFLSWANVEPHRARVLPNTVDERFTPGPGRTGVASRFGIEGKKVLLTVGRLCAAEGYKGHDRVIDALPQLLKTFGDLRYLIVGEGDDRARLEALAKARGLAGKLVFAGYVSDADLPDVYRLADALVLPSTGEGFGIVALEAAACGVPVIVGGGEGGVDAVADGALGTAVSARSLGELLAALNQVLGRGSATDARAKLAQEVRGRFGRPRFHAAVQMAITEFRT